LEQQRSELPLGESQQQLAGQPQQQPGLPPIQFTVRPVAVRSRTRRLRQTLTRCPGPVPVVDDVPDEHEHPGRGW